MNARRWIVVAGVTGALGVTWGAFGAHLLPDWLEKSGLSATEIASRMETFRTAVRYHMYHALALLGIGILARYDSSRRLRFAGLAFLFGVLIFSGLLYVMAITGIKFLGIIVPLGGALLIVGWIALALVGVTAVDELDEK